MPADSLRPMPRVIGAIWLLYFATSIVGALLTRDGALSPDLGPAVSLILDHPSVYRAGIGVTLLSNGLYVVLSALLFGLFVCAGAAKRCAGRPLADVSLGPGREEDVFLEAYSYAAADAFESVTGTSMPAPWLTSDRARRCTLDGRGAAAAVSANSEESRRGLTQRLQLAGATDKEEIHSVGD
jgi:hypothetical protein